MSLSSTTSRNDYHGADSVGPFAYTFRIFAAADLEVTKRSSANVETALAYPADFSVTGVGDRAGGTVTLTTALATGERLVIRRVPALTQPTDLRNAGAYFPETLEDQFDRLTMIDQSQQDQMNRALRMPVTYTPDSANLEIPLPEPGKSLVWNAAGTAMENRALDGAAAALPGDGRMVLTLSDYLDHNAVFNVADYGALTATSDAARVVAIQAALTAGAGKRVVFPPRAALSINAALTVPSGTTVVGYDATLTQTSEDTEILNIEDKSDVTIQELNLVGLGTDYAESDSRRGVGIFGGGSGSRIRVLGNTFTNFAYAAVRFRSQSGIVVAQNTIVGPGSAVITSTAQGRSYGVLLDADCDDAVVEGNSISEYAQGIMCQANNCRIIGNRIFDIRGQHGIYAGYGIENLVIANNVFANTALIGIKVQAAELEDERNIAITGNVVQSPGSHGIAVVSGLHPAGTFRCRSVVVVGNVVKDGAEDGINVDTTTGITIVGNTIDTVGRSGISVSDVADAEIAHNLIRASAASAITESTLASSDITIRDNLIVNCATAATAGNRYGIYQVQAASARWAVERNLIRDAAAQMEYGIFLAGGDPATFIVRDNIVTDATGTAARFKAGGAAFLAYEGNVLAGTGGATTNEPPLLSAASAANLTLPAGARAVTITGATVVQTINVGGWSGQTITLLFTGVTRIIGAGFNVRLAGGADFFSTADDTLTLTCDGSNWYEVARSVN